MNKEEQELAVSYLEDMKESYVEGSGYERHPLPEYYAIETAIKALGQEPILDKIRTEILDEAISHSGTGEEVIQAYVDGLNRALKIIDKYKAEMETQEWESEE